MSRLESSPEYSALHIADVVETFKTVVEKRPTVTSLIPLVTDQNRRATLHKHEWLEHKRVPSSWTVNGASSASSTALVLDSTSGVKVGDVLGFKTSAGASVTVRAKVTAVTNSTDLVITRLTSTGLADMTIPDNAVVSLISRAKPEGSTADPETNEKPTRNYNYTQIFRRDFQLTNSTLQSKVYGLKSENPADKRAALLDLVTFQAEAQLQNIAWELNQSVIDGYRQERADGGANGSMGGLREFVYSQARSRVDAAGAALTQEIINNAVNQAAENGADTANLTTILCHPTQARKISGFNTSGSNPVVVRGDVTAGSYVAMYQTDLAGTNGGALLQVVVDRSFPEDELLIFNPGTCRLVPLGDRAIGVTETTQFTDGMPTDSYDGRKWTIKGELTLEFPNANDDAVVVHSLSL